MDKEGWIPISLIASFHRVQALTQDVALIIKLNPNIKDWTTRVVYPLVSNEYLLQRVLKKSQQLANLYRLCQLPVLSIQFEVFKN